MSKKTQYGRTAFSAVAGITMVVSMAATPALAAEPAQDASGSTEGTEAEALNTTVEGVQVMDEAVGEFAYDQTTITPNAIIKDLFQRATRALCGATTDFVVDNPLEWKLTVSGDVKEAFTASVGDLAGEESVSKTMTCTCGGNPAGGAAIITAGVKGLPIEGLLSRAGANAGVNTLTFISSDGTEVAMPLAYVVGHHGVLSYEINGEDLSASVGGNNQLWMMKTPANYFVRDVVEIRVSTEEVVPEAPGTSDEHPNSPNAGVLAGSQE